MCPPLVFGAQKSLVWIGLILCVFKPHSFTFFLHGYYHCYSIDNGTVSFAKYFIYFSLFVRC